MGNCDFKAYKEAGDTNKSFWQRWQEKYTAFINPEKILVSSSQLIFLDCTYLFLERGRENEREGEKHQCEAAFHAPPTGDIAQTQAGAPTGI